MCSLHLVAEWSGHHTFVDIDSESVLCLKTASEAVRGGGSFQLESFVCGHCVYSASWTDHTFW